MQVVYSGGSSTPTPSPRLPRKTYGYGQPFMPGYLPGQAMPTSAHNTVAHLHHHHHHHHHRKAKVSQFSEGDASLRDSIPAMSKPVAITCLICNIFVPGLGTFISGLTVLCCSQIRHKGSTKQSVVRVNSWVALLQFLTAFLFLLGWIWSVMWGTAFLTISREYYKKSDSNSTSDHDPKTSTASGGAGERRQASSNAHTSDNASGTNAKITRTTQRAPAQQARPMIVLQESPPVLNAQTPEERNEPILGHINPRQQRIIGRQIDSEFSPFQLTHEALESIIVHDAAPVPNGNSLNDQLDEADPETKLTTSAPRILP